MVENESETEAVGGRERMISLTNINGAPRTISNPSLDKGLTNKNIDVFSMNTFCTVFVLIIYTFHDN